jgi:crotonobetainyl-CoA:carnitine CoA-transferase CaiB-like acyl-CoA transferase
VTRGPLAGVRVIDTSSLISAPLGTMMLADQGADVIKVEAPGTGDVLRREPFRRNGISGFFANSNRGKRSIVIDLRSDEGRGLLNELVKDADVFVENYRPGVADRMGIGEADLRTRNESLIYCSVNGFGDTGPYRDRRAYDPIIQGLTGQVSLQRHPDVDLPDLIRHVVVDKATAYVVAQAITAALYARDHGAGGQRVHVPMLDVGLSFFWPDGMMAHTVLGDDVRKGPTLSERYRLTDTADGHLIYWVGPNIEWYGLFRALDREDLCDDPRFKSGRDRVTNGEVLGELLREEFRKWSTEEIMARMVAEDVPVGPVNGPAEVMQDPQILHNDLIVERDHPTLGRHRDVRPAARFSETPQEMGGHAPVHGQHTDEVLKELGRSEADIERLRTAGVVS